MKAKIESMVIKFFVYLSAFLVLITLFSITMYVIYKGLPNIRLEQFSFKYTSNNLSILPALINTIIVTILSLLIAVPLGIFSAIYLQEYAKKDNKYLSFVRISIETLQGIPSIVYGLFGTLFFVTTLFKGYSLLAGSLTLSIMILPLIIRTTEEALKSVPKSFREESFALGAGKLRTIFKIVLPTATSSIFSGIILSIGRIIGETAALIYTAGTVAKVPPSIMGSGRTISVHMYALWNEGINQKESYATAVILLIGIIIMNYISEILSKKIKRFGG